MKDPEGRGGAAYTEDIEEILVGHFEVGSEVVLNHAGMPGSCDELEGRALIGRDGTGGGGGGGGSVWQGRRGGRSGANQAAAGLWGPEPVAWTQKVRREERRTGGGGCGWEEAGSRGDESAEEVRSGAQRRWLGHRQECRDA